MNKQKSAPETKGGREQKDESRTNDQGELRRDDSDQGATLEGQGSQARQGGSTGTGKETKAGQQAKTDGSCGCG